MTTQTDKSGFAILTPVAIAGAAAIPAAKLAIAKAAVFIYLI